MTDQRREDGVKNWARIVKKLSHSHHTTSQRNVYPARNAHRLTMLFRGLPHSSGYFFLSYMFRIADSNWWGRITPPRHDIHHPCWLCNVAVVSEDALKQRRFPNNDFHTHIFLSDRKLQTRFREANGAWIHRTTSVTAVLVAVSAGLCIFSAVVSFTQYVISTN